MLRKLRPRSAYDVVALLALFVALGGSAYAVTSLPKNSVGTDQLKKNAVTSSKTKDHSLLAKDFKAGELPRGARGPKGATGAPGSARAYAHVRSDGTLDMARTKNVLGVSRPCTIFDTSCPAAAQADPYQCFKLNFTPQNAVANGDFGDSGGTDRNAISVAVPAQDFSASGTGCPAGYTAAWTYSYKATDGTPQSGGFWILFN